MRRVVITGIGGICPIGNNVSQIWESVLNNKSGIIKNEDDKLNVKVLARVKDIKLEDYLSPKEIHFNSKFINYALIAAKEAYVDSDLSKESIDGDRFGVIVSSCIGGTEKIVDSYENNKMNSYYIPSILTSSVASKIAIELKANGINMSINTACASGNNAIGEAYLKIKDGLQDIMIAGASEFAITDKLVDGFNAMRAIYGGDDINKASIPFDVNREGFVLGEGAGILILEDLEHALKRKAKIYGEIVSYSSNCDAYHIARPELSGLYSGKAIKSALDNAGLLPQDIDYINAHGTGTIINDITETLAIKNAFGEHYKNPLISSTKSMTGHLLSASGAIEAIICLKSLQEGFVPATINSSNIDPKCDLNIVYGEGIRKDIKYALSNSFGFGGDNACLIFKKWME